MMTWQQAIAALRTELKNLFEQQISGLFGWTLTSHTTAMGDGDQVQTSDENKSQRPARRIEQWGVRGVPPRKLRTLWVRLGTSNVLYIGVAPTSRYGPTDLAAGETAVYSEQIEKALHATSDGDCKLAAKNGRRVHINGNDYVGVKWSDGSGVPLTDQGFVGALYTFLNSVSAATTAAQIATAATIFKAAMDASTYFTSDKWSNG